MVDYTLFLLHHPLIMLLLHICHLILLLPFHFLMTLLFFSQLIRSFRSCISLVGKLHSDTESELNISISPEPWDGLLSTLMKFDSQKEIIRRRSSYLKCSEECEKIGGAPIFSELPPYCAPYAYAFRGDQSVVSTMQNYADQQGFDMVLWPDLPEVIVCQAPKHYRNIYLINLTW